MSTTTEPWKGLLEMAVGDLLFSIDPSKGETPQTIARKRQIAEAILGQTSRAPKDIGEGLNSIGQAILYRKMMGGIDKAETAGASGAAKVFGSLFGNQFPPAPSAASATPTASPEASEAPTGVPGDIGEGIKATAASLGIDPIDLGTAISYETDGTFDPMKKGPTTQWGQHQGLIQFGEPQAKEYGVDWSNPIGSQLGPDGAIAKYLTAHGVKPGMKLLDIYSAINAGGVGKYDASDANNGGAPGTVRDKVENQMAGHRAKALALLGGNQVASNGAPEAIAYALNGQEIAPDRAIPPEIAAKIAAASQQMPSSTPLPAGVDPQSLMTPMPFAAPQQPTDARQAIAAAMGGGVPQQAPVPPQGGPVTPAAPDTMAPGQPAAVSDPAKRVLAAMMQQQSMTGGAPMPMQSAPGVTPSPVTAEVPPTTQAPEQVAQAAPVEDLSKIPVMAGGTAGALPPGAAQQDPSIEQLMQAASDPFVMEKYGPVVNAMLEQKMKASEPATQLAMQKARLDMEKTRIETEQLRNPQMSPADKARLDFDREKLAADQKKLMELSPGTTVFDPNSREAVFAAPEKAEAKPAGIQEYEYAKQQGFPGTFQDWEASKKGGMSLQVDPTTGEVTFQQGGNIKPMTEAQSKDTTFATRAAGALPLVDKFGDALTSLPESAGGQVPVIGNYMKSPEYQQAEQAGKEFLQAILRKDTGAAITAGETSEYGSVYLPRPGDSPELLAQKKSSRARALEALKAGMTPQAILAQEKAVANSTTPETPSKAKPKAPVTIDGFTIEEVP